MKRVICALVLICVIMSTLTSCVHVHRVIHSSTPSTCTELGKYTSQCKCGYSPYYFSTIPIDLLPHDEVDGVCTKCGTGVKFVFPEFPQTSAIHDEYRLICEIEDVQVERLIGKCPSYRLTFILKSTFNEKGESYSDNASFAWRLYDEDDCFIKSGVAISETKIKVGEKSKAVIEIDTYISYAATYTFKIVEVEENNTNPQ